MLNLVACSQAPGELELSNKNASVDSSCYSLKGSSLSTASYLSNVIFPDGFDMSGFNSTGVSLQGLDLSKTKGLTVQMLSNAASSISGIILPPSFDMTGFDANGKTLSNIDLSDTQNLSAASFNGATRLYNITLPSGFNLTGLNTSGMTLAKMNLKNTTGLTVQMLNDAQLEGEILLPDGFNVTGLDLTGQNHATDFSNTVGLTIEMLDNSTVFSGKIPPGLDISNLDYSNAVSGTMASPIQKYIKVDFSQAVGIDLDIFLALARCDIIKVYLDPIKDHSCNILPSFDVSLESFSGYELHNMNLKSMINLTGVHIQDSDSGLQEVHAPLSGIDFTGYTGKFFLEMVDLSNSTNLTASMINNTDYMRATVFPAMDFTGVTRNFSFFDDADFSNVTNLTAAQINNNTFGFKNYILPDGFDISGVDFTGCDMDYGDYSNTVGMTASQVEKIIGSAPNTFTPVVLPAVDLSTLDTTGLTLWNIDFSNTINFNASHLSNATGLSRLILPTGMDLSGLTLSTSTLQDFKVATNFPASQVNMATVQNLPLGTDLSLLTPTTYSNKDSAGNVFPTYPSLSIAQINALTYIDYTTLPDDYDLTGFDPSGLSGINRFDAYKAKNFPISALNKGIDFKYFTPPKDFDISSWDSTGKSMQGWDLRDVKGLSMNHLANASSISQVKLPNDFDFTGAYFNNAILSQIDLSNLQPVSCE